MNIYSKFIKVNVKKLGIVKIMYYISNMKKSKSTCNRRSVFNINSLLTVEYQKKISNSKNHKII